MMLGRLWKLVMVGLVFSTVAWARTYYLPDYQDKISTRASDSSGQKAGLSCSSYANYYSSVQSGLNCDSTVRHPAAGLNCYYCTGCSSDYKYTASDCPTDTYTLSGGCGGKYKACYCRADTFPTTSTATGCPEGKIPDTSAAATCMDKPDGTSHFKCIDDPCPDKITTEQCAAAGNKCVASTNSACTNRCAQCLEQCEYEKQINGAIESTTCEYGCATGKEVSGCSGLCQKGGCRTEPLACATGYATKVSDCSSSGLTLVSNSSFTLNPNKTSGTAGGATCQECTITCNSGYTMTNGTCKATACPDGYATERWKCTISLPEAATYALDYSDSNGVSGTSLCYRCTYDCDYGIDEATGTCSTGCTAAYPNYTPDGAAEYAPEYCEEGPDGDDYKAGEVDPNNEFCYRCITCEKGYQYITDPNAIEAARQQCGGFFRTKSGTDYCWECFYEDNGDERDDGSSDSDGDDYDDNDSGCEGTIEQVCVEYDDEGICINEVEECL